MRVDWLYILVMTFCRLYGRHRAGVSSVCSALEDVLSVDNGSIRSKSVDEGSR